MKHVAIVQTVGDLAKKTKLQKKLPAEYPVQCQEYDSKEEAEKSHPGKQIMSVEAYNGYQAGTKIVHRHFTRKPWWKIWGKK